MRAQCVCTGSRRSAAPAGLRRSAAWAPTRARPGTRGTRARSPTGTRDVAAWAHGGGSLDSTTHGCGTQAAGCSCKLPGCRLQAAGCWLQMGRVASYRVRDHLVEARERVGTAGRRVFDVEAEVGQRSCSGAGRAGGWLRGSWCWLHRLVTPEPDGYRVQRRHPCEETGVVGSHSMCVLGGRPAHRRAWTRWCAARRCGRRRCPPSSRA